MNPQEWQKIKAILEEAIETAPDRRASFLNEACGGNEDLRREVESLLDFEETTADPLEEPAFSAVMGNDFGDTTATMAKTLIGRQIGKYKITGELGAGGMGVVFLAERADGTFSQRVALKLIKRGMDSDAVLRRFITERQILATLDHPNIAHLIDGGTTDDGLPYFVLEYIEGETIIDFAERENLDLEARLKLFREVCAAVSFAHRNLVIHRDLKPSNILVTVDRTPKLLDFGIAKLLKTEPGTETATRNFVFTPEYASPEQIRGEKLSTATDVYSLGIILYELLTGDRPYKIGDSSLSEVIRLICEIEPERPSATANRSLSAGKSKTADRKEPGTAEENRQATLKSKLQTAKALRGDLDNIILKALRKEPERRYSSVEQFSEDVRRHLEGLPVAASKGTWNYRASKFIQRNRIGVAAAALVLLSLLGGLAATLYQTNVARRERAKAEQRFNDVRQLANSFVFEINEKIDESPIKARELLVRRAEQYLDKLAAEAEGDQGLQSELATAYQKIGDIQSGLHRSNLGDTHGALKNYAKALKIHEQLYLADSQNLSAGLNFSTSCLKMGDVSAKTGNIAAATENYVRAVDFNERFLLLEPENTQVRQQLAQSLLKLGQAEFRTGDLSKVLTIYNRSLSIYEKLAAENPGDPKLQRSPAVLLSYTGFVLGEMGDYRAALDSFRKSLEISERLLAADPDNLQAQRDRREFLHWVGIQYKELGDTASSLAHHQKSQSITRELLKRDETDVQERNTLADSQMETAKTLMQAGQTAQAIASFEDAIDNYEQVRKSDEKNAHVRRQISYTKMYLADAHVHIGATNKALENLQKSLAVFEELTGVDPNNTEWQNDLAVCRLKTGEIFLKNGDKTKASDNFARALPTLEKLVSQSPEHAARRANLEAVKKYLGELKA